MNSEYELLSTDWLNGDFFENLLKESEKDTSIKVTSLAVTPASVNNDHRGSLMYRAKIEYNSSKGNNLTISLVAKVMPEQDSTMKEMLENTSIFKTEIRMYTEAIPKMEAVLRKYGDDTVLGARVFYTSLEPHQIIIFEDLAEKGFSTLKNRMPTEEEIKEAMLRIAKWHAVSYKLAHEEPESMTTYNDGTFDLDMDKMEFLASGIKSFIKLLSSVDELKEYIPHFQELDKHIMKRCINMSNAFKRGDKAIFVLNHGDFHQRNIMFRHKKTGELDDLILIDFQMSNYGPAVADVMFAIYLLWDSETRLDRRDEMIYYYFSNFIDSLRKFDYKGGLPTMSDFQIDLINYRSFETFLLSNFLPFAHAFVDETIDSDKINESSEERMKIYLNPILMNEIKRTLPKFLQRGYLE